MLHNLRIQYLSKKLIKNVLASIESRHEIDMSFLAMLKEAEEVKIVYGNGFEVIVFDNVAALFKIQGREEYMPTLYVINMFYNTKKILIVPSVLVDEGAIAPLKRGADVMLPGIKKVLKSFNKGDIVAVMEPGERYFIAVGIALLGSNSITPGAKGKGIENISHIDDNIWLVSLQLAKALS